MKIIKYGASWCGPCRTMAATLKESKYPYEEIDVDEHPEFISEKNIKSIPYIEIVDDNDKVGYTHVGPLTKTELDDVWQLLIARGVI